MQQQCTQTSDPWNWRSELNRESIRKASPILMIFFFLSFFPFFSRYLKHRSGKNWRAHTIDRRRKITREDKKIRSMLSLPPYRFEDYFLFLCFIYTRRKYAFVTNNRDQKNPWWTCKYELWLVTLVRVSRRCRRRIIERVE